MKERGILAREQKKAYEAVKAEPTNRPNEDARRWMCDNYFDVRTFGAVMTTGKSGASDDDEKKGVDGKKGVKRELKLWNCGQVRGPVQIGFGRSQAPILSLEHAITRVALTNPGDTDRAAENGAEDEKAGSGQMGRKHTVPYGLYRTHGFISPFLAKDTGFGDKDYELLLEALTNMFEVDRSATRCEMAVRALGVFEHQTALGNAPAHQLLDSIKVEGPPVARSFGEYRVNTPAPASPGVNFRWVVDPGGRV